ncbi:b131 [miniopterid betaherpesvirus 1]|uniref:B131 n=1 Tax=miniopterid betaherpesvirus 1 TaxID=3070189 RepID=I3VQC8_9BETA|nr:b131 [miniopterid betaherpesvirus 1]AFK83972.1 b131 [miniopterid betaherpesvirus 1]
MSLNASSIGEERNGSTAPSNVPMICTIVILSVCLLFALVIIIHRSWARTVLPLSRHRTKKIILCTPDLVNRDTVVESRVIKTTRPVARANTVWSVDSFDLERDISYDRAEAAIERDGYVSGDSGPYMRASIDEDSHDYENVL